MLNKKEVAVMRCVYNACKKHNDSAIISDERIIQSCPEKFALDNAKVDAILKQLEYDGYFECTKSERNGKTVNVFSLKQKGKAFEREMTQRRRELANTMLWRVIFAAIGAVVALLVTKIMGG